MKTIFKLLLASIIVLANAVCHAQQNELPFERLGLKRTAQENGKRWEAFKKDTIYVPMDKVLIVDGFYLYPDTLNFSNLDVRLYLPNRALQQISFFQGKKIYDITLFPDSMKEDNPGPVISFWYGGEFTSRVSLDDDLNITEEFSNDYYADIGGEKEVNGELMYYRKIDFYKLKFPFTITLIYCELKYKPLCDSIIEHCLFVLKKEDKEFRYIKGAQSRTFN